MKRLIYILFALCCTTSNAWSTNVRAPQQPANPLGKQHEMKGEQRETIIIGDIYDAANGRPLPNVNVYLQGTDIGTISNAEGMFLLRGQVDRAHTLIVSAVGYHTERFRIEVGQQVGIDIALREKVSSLADVFVYPGVNPALPLMDEVRKHRQANQQTTMLDQAHQNLACYVSDIQPKHLRKTLWKSLQTGMLQAEDSTYLIPLYWRRKKEQQVEEQATLLTTTDYNILLNDLQSTCDFYNNHIQILSTSLLSPLAAAGNSYYNYYLADSMQVGNEKHYLVHFRTKNAFYATFNGEMAIDSATYALRSIKATVPSQTNINFLRQLTIHQYFTQCNHLVNERLSLLLDFAIKTDTSHIFPTLLITRNTSFPHHSISPSPHRLIASSHNSPIVSAMDSLSNTPLFRTAKFVAYVLQTGYIPTGKYIEIGKVNELLKYNQVEGWRMALPLRTTEMLWQRVSLGGYISFATGDRACKGMGEVNIALPTQKRHTIQVRYGDHYVYSDVNDFQEYIRENQVFNPQINLITELLRGAPFNKPFYYNTMVRRREARMHFEDEWNSFLETQAYLKIGRMGYGTASRDYMGQKSFFYSTLGASARISFHERKIDSYFHRRHIYNHLPVVYLGAELGSYQLADMPRYRMYGNLRLMVRQKVNLGIAGNLNYLLEAGMIFGNVPYPLLHIFAGNPSYTLDAQRFTLMNTYQYAADRYVSIHAQWDGNGLLLNRVPGIRYLRLRELVEVKVAYGSMHEKHAQVLVFPHLSDYKAEQASAYSLLSAPTVPYVEVGVGLGNILRIGEVYGVFRLTHWHDAHAPWWGLRFRLHLGM